MFKEKLETLGLEVVLWDERLTTVAAQKILISADVSRKKEKDNRSDGCCTNFAKVIWIVKLGLYAPCL